MDLRTEAERAFAIAVVDYFDESDRHAADPESPSKLAAFNLASERMGEAGSAVLVEGGVQRFTAVVQFANAARGA